MKAMISRKVLASVFVCLFAVSIIVIAVAGRRYSGTCDLTRWGLDDYAGCTDELQVTAEDPEIVEVTGIRADGTLLKYELRALKGGVTYLLIGTPEEEEKRILNKFYVHRFGIITEESFFGSCTGGFMIPLSILIMMVLLWADRAARLRDGVRKSLYSYRNIMIFGQLVFMTSLIMELILTLPGYNGIESGARSLLHSAGTFTNIVLPVAFVMFVLISLSNLSLMRKEGVNWHNMLGFLLGLGLCLMTVLPTYLYEFLLRTQIIDIFNERGIGTHLYNALEYTVFFTVSYLECILLGTIVFSVRAARHIPAFDREYILILGSQIRTDGTLPPLLRARADRAIEFARMQREAGGPEIIFVPSGGKGDDEVMAEGDAIARYLVSRGIPEERILIENRSANTEENIRNSMEIIRKNRGESSNDPRAAFSTTNYHVFRAGLIATKAGCRMEGIGSPTKRYFWINAFVREFVATIVSERKRHLHVILALVTGILAMEAVLYFSIVL